MLKTFEAFYVKKDFASALETLQKNSSSITPSLLHYNLGTVYSRMENWSDARYHFLLAESADPSLPNLVQNRELVEERLDVARYEKPSSALDYAIKGSLIASHGTLTTMSLIVLVVGLIVLRKKATLVKVLAWSALMATPVLLNVWVNRWPKALSMQAQAISDGPSSIFNSTNELPAGVMVIVKKQGEWRQIIWPSRFSGWVRASGLKALE